jgi:hypothetical protein
MFSKHFNEKGNENATISHGENVYLGNGKEDVKELKPVTEENVSTQLGLFSLLSTSFPLYASMIKRGNQPQMQRLFQI